MTTIIDGNTFWIGYLVDNILALMANIFGGLATFGTTMGLLIGVAFVLGLIFIATGKASVGKITGMFK